MHDIRIAFDCPDDGSGKGHITVSFPEQWGEALTHALNSARARADDPRIDDIVATMKRLIIMSQTVQQTVDANNATTASALDAIQTDVTEIAAELAAAIPPVGTTVSQESVDAMTANVKRLTTLKTSLDALATPVTSGTSSSTSSGGTDTSGGTVTSGGTAVTFNDSDLTPNAPGGRNTSHLPGFDASQPETA
jgi:hypothetical protein